MTEIQLLEKEIELIDQFKESFRETMGYYPDLFIRSTTLEDRVPQMSLDELEKLFEPHLPYVFSEKVGLRKKCRVRKLVELRFIFCYLARKMEYSMVNIGIYLGQDHSTVVYSVQTFKDLMKHSPSFIHLYKTVLKSILTQLNLYNEPSIMENELELSSESESALLP